MVAGTEVEMDQGPCGVMASNHTPFWQLYHSLSLTRMTGVEVLVAYASDVPSMAASAGSLPSKNGAGSSFAKLRSILVVVGMLLAITASCAWRVPGTDAFTFSFGLSSGIFAKSAGRLLPGMYVQGPPSPGALNQRPEVSR